MADDFRPMPLQLTGSMIAAVREDPTTKVDDRDTWHQRLGWLICAYDVMLRAAPVPEPSIEESIDRAMDPRDKYLSVISRPPVVEWLDPGLLHKLWHEWGSLPGVATPKEAFTAGVRAAEAHYRITPPAQDMVRPKSEMAEGQEDCNYWRRIHGQSYPRTCKRCGLGICKFAARAAQFQTKPPGGFTDNPIGY